MTDTYTVQPRTTTGKQVQRLRREGVLPANIFGRGLESTPVQIAHSDARTILNTHGLNTIINVQVEGESESRPVLVREVALEPVTRAILHLDLYQVDLSRMVRRVVPIKVNGRAPAVAKFSAAVVQLMDTVEVEGLPNRIPAQVVVEVGRLLNLDDVLHVRDIQAPAGLKLHAPADAPVVTVRRAS